MSDARIPDHDRVPDCPESGRALTKTENASRVKKRPITCRCGFIVRTAYSRYAGAWLVARHKPKATA